MDQPDSGREAIRHDLPSECGTSLPIKINEVSFGTASNASNQFIEISNASSNAIDISTVSVVHGIGKALGFRSAHADADQATTRSHRDTELLRKTEPQDLIKYGLIPEFVGRLPVMGILDELDEAALIEILTKPRNAIIKQYQRLFEYENVRLHFTQEAACAIAREALARKVGARGLRMILKELMLDLMYHLPSNKRARDIEIKRTWWSAATSRYACSKKPADSRTFVRFDLFFV